MINVADVVYSKITPWLQFPSLESNAVRQTQTVFLLSLLGSLVFLLIVCFFVLTTFWKLYSIWVGAVWLHSCVVLYLHESEYSQEVVEHRRGNGGDENMNKHWLGKSQRQNEPNTKHNFTGYYAAQGPLLTIIICKELVITLTSKLLLHTECQKHSITWLGLLYTQLTSAFMRKKQ